MYTRIDQINCDKHLLTECFYSVSQVCNGIKYIIMNELFKVTGRVARGVDGQVIFCDRPLSFQSKYRPDPSPYNLSQLEREVDPFA